MAPAELTLTAMATAAACAVPGVFLVLRRLALVGDAIGHVILLGIAVGFLLGGSLQSPLVVIGAAAVGLLAVFIVEWLERSGLVRNDAALGLVYPALFSVGVILVSIVSKTAGSVHLDVDAVLLGELAQAPLRPFWPGVIDWPVSMVVMTGMFVLNLVFVSVFYKELKLTTFDPEHAKSLGFRLGWVHYPLMALVSLTVVTAFDAAGAVLVVGFLVAPAAIAFLLTDRLGWMLTLALGLALISAFGGTELASYFDANIAGSIAAVMGGIFAVALLFSPRHGIVAKWHHRLQLHHEFEQGLLLVHLLHHEGTPAAVEENRADRLGHHLQWPNPKVKRVLTAAMDAGTVRMDRELVQLTDLGRITARRLLDPTAD